MINKKRIHFIGIGGISMSGLAEIAIKNGFQVTGSDMKGSHLIDRLIRMGAKVVIPHEATSVEGADLVVYTAAVKMTNPEMAHAAQLGIPMEERATYLGRLMKGFPYGIAISGTHGKTTTTSMAGIVFQEANLDPTILVGGEVTTFGGNVVTGNSEYFITEACEYVESFLKFYPFIGVILNVEADHLDYFRDLDHVKESFSKFADLIPDGGSLVVSAECPNTMDIASRSGKNVVSFGIEAPAEFTARELVYDRSGHGEYILYRGDSPLVKVLLSVPGRHNVLNSLAVMATAIISGISPETAASGIRKFIGTGRRFELKGMENGVTVIDDYAHHPTEIKATLEAASNLDHRRIWVVFQPHTYTRTRTLFQEFGSAFQLADSVILTDIYAARESDPGDVSVVALSELISENGVMCQYCSDFNIIADILSESAHPGDLVFTMGAGDVNSIAPLLLDRLKAFSSVGNLEN